jgi:hypothetical protein
LTFQKSGIWSVFGKVTVENLAFCNLVFGKKHSTGKFADFASGDFSSFFKIQNPQNGTHDMTSESANEE